MTMTMLLNYTGKRNVQVAKTHLSSPSATLLDHDHRRHSVVIRRRAAVLPHQLGEVCVRALGEALAPVDGILVHDKVGVGV